MKRKNYFTVVLLSAMLIAGLGSASFAATLSIDATPTTVGVDGTITVTVSITDEANTLAGAALSIEYSTNFVDAAVDTVGGYVDSNFFDNVVDTVNTGADPSTYLPIEANADETTGIVMLSGAYNKGAPAGPLNGLFIVKFTAKAEGEATFKLKQSMLLNDAAGWGTDTDQDEVRDTAEAVPALVGIDPNWETTAGTDGDFPPITATFPTDPVTVTIAAASGSNIPLSAGWNLISISVQPADTSVGNVLSSIAGQFESVWSYNLNSFTKWDIYYADPNRISTLSDIVPGKAYWINATSDATLTVSGSPAPNQVALKTGWNFVGYTGEAKSAAEVLSSISGQYESVWTHNRNSFTGWDIYYSDPNRISTLQNFEPGKGYWINATADTTLTY